VSYDSDGFLEKNRDTLTPDLLEMLYTSKLEYMNILFDKSVVVSTKEQKSSLSKQFQQQLFDLMVNNFYLVLVKPVILVFRNNSTEPNRTIFVASSQMVTRLFLALCSEYPQTTRAPTILFLATYMSS
jgi:hypothetical protein